MTPELKAAINDVMNKLQVLVARCEQSARTSIQLTEANAALVKSMQQLARLVDES